MLDEAKIIALLEALNEELRKKDVRGEIGLCGGAVMCLVFHARKATRDVDAIFQPTGEIRAAAKRVAEAHQVDPHWLNDAVKGFFLTQPPRESVLELSHLSVWAPSAEYMLAMKCVSARYDTHDLDDVKFLLQQLKIDHTEKAYGIIEKYYPQQQIPPKTQFLLEELLPDRAR